jgi:hypothetical protein
MPPRSKNPASPTQPDGSAAVASGVDDGKRKRNMQLETTALLSWLSVPENRNIVTGGAGVFTYEM